MKRITTPAPASFLLCTVAASGDPDGWRFCRRLQRVESFQSDD